MGVGLGFRVLIALDNPYLVTYMTQLKDGGSRTRAGGIANSKFGARGGARLNRTWYLLRKNL